MISRRAVLASLAFGAAFAAAPAWAQAQIEQIGTAELKAGLADGSVVLIDVREPDEFASGHVAGATLMPLSRFDPTRLPAAQPGKKIVMMCRSGNRSQRAIAMAQAAGRRDIHLNYEGGILNWVRSGEIASR